MIKPEEQFKILSEGVEKIFDKEEFLLKLKQFVPLRIKLGVDPTSSDLHLGHTVVLEKLRQFQDLGHKAILIIGDFTARIGDPTGRSKVRPVLSQKEIDENAKTYKEQAFKILDSNSTEIHFNSKWFNKMSFSDVIKLNSIVTIQQILQREDFKNRIASNNEIRLHEIQYPIVQGWDSVAIKSDVEIGGTDQLFNILIGRDLQKKENMNPQTVMCMPILEGLDGVKKMSKSLNNYVSLIDSSTEMFGKIMSISDDLMGKYYLLLTGQKVDESLHPLEAKKNLARDLVSKYFGENSSQEEFLNWNKRLDLKESIIPLIPIINQSEKLSDLVKRSFDFLGEPKSSSDIRRLISQGAIQINGKKQTDHNSYPSLSSGYVLRLGKKRRLRFK